MTEPPTTIRAGDLRLLNKAGLIERVEELLAAEDLHVAEIESLRQRIDDIEDELRTRLRCDGVARAMTQPAPTHDLVRKLRARVQHNHIAADKWSVFPDPLCQDAADAIERLTEKVIELEQLHD
jgi:hypothetical protein